MSHTSERQVQRLDGAATDCIAVEEPLEIRVETEPFAVLMRTPGHDRELVAGFLRSEGIIEHLDDIKALETIAKNTVDCRLGSGVEAHRTLLAARSVVTSSACGICGRRSLDQVHLQAPGPIRHKPLDEALIELLPERLRQHQSGFEATGCLHAAALFDPDGSLRIAREDVGRHNAVDKVLGWDLLGEDRGGALVVSSRAGFEIVQKARMAQVGTVLAFGAATTLAVDLAQEAGMQLYGFVGRGRYTRYS